MERFLMVIVLIGVAFLGGYLYGLYDAFKDEEDDDDD